MASAFPHATSMATQNENSLNQNVPFSKDAQTNAFGAVTNNRMFGRELTNNIGGAKPDPNAEKAKVNNVRTQQFHQSKSLPVGGLNVRMSFAGDTVVEKMSIEGKEKAIAAANKDSSRMIDDGEMEQFDKDNYHNTQYVAQYMKDIFIHLRATEEKSLPNASYMTKVQKDINEKMRAILIDWLIDVHLKFKLLPETLFLTINLIDRYLSNVDIPRQKLQLVGVASMLIACKYEEIYPPEIKEFEYVTDKAYNREEIIDMEGKILALVHFNLVSSSPYRFLERYGRLAGLDEKGMFLARYLLELSLVEFKMMKYIPSNLACSSIYLVNKIFKKEGWPEQLMKSCKYNETQIRPCAKDLCLVLQNAGKSSLQAVKKKYSQTKFGEVAKLQLDKL